MRVTRTTHVLIYICARRENRMNLYRLSKLVFLIGKEFVLLYLYLVID
jgi:hypothetical protein